MLLAPLDISDDVEPCAYRQFMRLYTLKHMFDIDIRNGRWAGGGVLVLEAQYGSLDDIFINTMLCQQRHLSTHFNTIPAKESNLCPRRTCREVSQQDKVRGHRSGHDAGVEVAHAPAEPLSETAAHVPLISASTSYPHARPGLNLRQAPFNTTPTTLLPPHTPSTSSSTPLYTRKPLTYHVCESTYAPRCPAFRILIVHPGRLQHLTRSFEIASG